MISGPILGSGNTTHWLPVFWNRYPFFANFTTTLLKTIRWTICGRWFISFCVSCDLFRCTTRFREGYHLPPPVHLQFLRDLVGPLPPVAKLILLDVCWASLAKPGLAKHSHANHWSVRKLMVAWLGSLKKVNLLGKARQHVETMNFFWVLQEVI